MNKARLQLLPMWLVALGIYIGPWAESNRGLQRGFDLVPFTLPYLVGLVLGLATIFVSVHRPLLSILASALMIIGALLTIFWWYGLALHYVTTGGGTVKLLPGVWFALGYAIVCLVIGAYDCVRKPCQVT